MVTKESSIGEIGRKSALDSIEVAIELKSDLFVIQEKKNWYLFKEEVNKKTRLYSKKEVSKILKTSKFTNLTRNLVEIGIFSLAHYFCYKSNSKNKINEFWTDKGVSILQDMLIISREEEETYITHYYFVAENLGEKKMFLVVTNRHNLLYPDDIKEPMAVENYMSSSWGSFSSKNKESFDRFLTILYGIRKDIESGVEICCYNSETKTEEPIIMDKFISFSEMIV